MTYYSTIHADNPIHWWRLSERGGSLAHDFGFTQVHLSNVDIKSAPLGYSGVSSDGGASYMDAITGFLHSGNEILNVPGSVEVWVWFDATNNGVTYTFTQWGTAGGNLFSMYIDGSGLWHVQFGAADLHSAAALPQQQWVHLVATNDGSTTRAYRNGVLDFSGASVASSITAFPYVGRNAAGTLGMSGLMAEYATYSSALSLSTIAAHTAAADTSASVPQYTLPGSSAPGTGAPIDISAQLASILAAVQKTFPTT